MQETVIGRYDSQMEAEMWAELLRQAGIPNRVVRVGAAVAAVGLDALVPHDLQVRAEDAQRARALLGQTD